MRSKDQILLEEAYQKILFNDLVKESHPEKKDSDDDVEDSEKESDDDSENDDSKNKNFKKETYGKKGTCVKSENFVHGIQPISEAKKKSVNPYAVCTATVGRKDEEKYKSCKKKVTAGAKKAGKKVTTKPAKKK